MARYVAGECYAYAGRQADLAQSGRRAVTAAYQPVTFSNAQKRCELDADMEDIREEMRRFVGRLNGAAFAPTHFG
jgi:GH25 family lysozyme M1 (1,4-beta-N-acetylmuramidase)